MPYKKLIIHTDGGARGNPGHAGIGIVIEDQHTKEIYHFKKYIGETTNNQAEYQALLFALEKARDMKADEAACYLDSELVVKQLRGEYRVKDQKLAPLFLKIWNLQQQFRKITFTHIFREKNKSADTLVNEAIDHYLAGRESLTK
jgi:ribonuclease HI